jgi:hypothetical protein
MDDFDKNDSTPENVDIRSTWVAIAEVDNRTLAEFAVNGLKSYDIPAVLDSRAGFLGAAGMQLRSFHSGKTDMFRILVPPDREEEASEVVKIFLSGDAETEADEET